VRRLQLTRNGGRPLIGLGRRQGNGKRTASAGPGGDCHAAAVCGNDLSDEGEPQAVAVDLTRHSVRTAIERVEDVREF
jgi:hypothetical protein